ncbi:MAG: cobalamin B12-binding domain-containing protein [Pararhodobacter sp.]|nr:cobalamin B12-binding domain-containing protein [Pararhodobacter sp.]
MVNNETDLVLAESAVAKLEHLRTRTVEAITDQIYQRLGESLAPFGERGRTYCRDDLHFHLDHLIGSLIAGSSRPFEAYVIWLYRLLDARGVPSASVDLSLELLGRYLHEHLPPEQSQAVESILAKGRSALSGPPANAVVPFSGFTQLAKPHPLTEALVNALVAGDRPRARALLEQATAEGDYLEGAVTLIQPAMYRVGERWHAREISVAQEHLASALVQQLLADRFAAAHAAPPSGSRAIFACVATNRHALGLQIVADAFELDGWSVEFLGADTPTADLVERVVSTKPDLVGLSVSLTAQLARLREAVLAIRSRMGDCAPQILAGGFALADISGVAERLGVDGWYSTALSAVKASK